MTTVTSTGRPQALLAADLFENYLKLTPFFTRHQDYILEKLEECERVVESAQRNQNMIFFAESLPIIDGMIQVGTKRAAYDDALRRIQRQLHKWGKDVDPANVISILAFVHVANRGEEIAQAKGADTLAIWRRIKARVESFVP
ncbi:MAG TPA: hypothetical protein VKU44_11475 [Terriglobia bacterium]|jgi:hypothetical protein|nr:hypothetical protein [Terriglobia bacterium]